MFNTFPFNKLETIKFSLLCHPFVYQRITKDDCEKILTMKGDFVIDLGDDADVLHLYLRCNGSEINVFNIKLCMLSNPRRIGFSFVNGSFGYGTIITLNNGQRAFIRSLNSSFTQNLSLCSNILEELLQLKHDNICQIRDYNTCECGDGLPAVVVVRSDCYLQNLQEYFSTKTVPFPTHQYIFWFYQITSSLSYLRENGITYYWSESDESALQWWLPKKTLKIDKDLSEDVFMRRDLWRNVSSEVLLGHPWTDQSFIWTFALLFQQMLTHGKRPHRVRYSTLIDFLSAGAKDDEICFLKDSAPSILTNFLSECFQHGPNNRPTFTEALNIVNLHYNRYRIVNFFNRF